MFTEVARGIILGATTPGDMSMTFDPATKPSLLLSWVWGVSWDSSAMGISGRRE
jgi:hypothetical protein